MAPAVIFDVQHQTTYTWRVWHHDDSKLITQQQTSSCCEDKGLASVCFCCSLNQKTLRRKDSHMKGPTCWESTELGWGGGCGGGGLPLIKEVESLQAQRPLFRAYLSWQVSIRVRVLTVSVWHIRYGLCLVPTLLVDNELWLNMNAECLVAGAQSWNRIQSGPQAA